MSDYSKEILSGSTLGVGIEIDQTTVGNALTVHTVPNTAGLTDEVWIYAYNTTGSAVDLTLWWGGVSPDEHDIKQSIPGSSGLQLVSPGLLLGEAKIIKAHASAVPGVVLVGYTNRITP